MKPLNWWQRSIIYSATGWCIEVLFSSLANLMQTGDIRLQGNSYIWMLPVWGFGVLGFEQVIKVLDKHKISLRVRLFIFMALCFALEYGFGYLLKVVIGQVPWDYSNSTWNIDSYIRLDYGPFWAMMGMFLEPYVDFVKRLRVENK
jgi:uncharacterized membrane protein